jgi:hypothetical protein
MHILRVEADDGAATEAGGQQQQDGAVALACAVPGATCGEPDQRRGRRRGGATLGAAARLAQQCAQGGIDRRGRQSATPMLVGDGSDAAGKRAVAIGRHQGLRIGGDGRGLGRAGRAALGAAPDGESGPVAGIEAPRLGGRYPSDGPGCHGRRGGLGGVLRLAGVDLHVGRSSIRLAARIARRPSGRQGQIRAIKASWLQAR